MLIVQSSEYTDQVQGSGFWVQGSWKTTVSANLKCTMHHEP